MTTFKTLLLLLAVTVLFPADFSRAEDAAAAAEARMRQMRDSVKSLTIQLRDAQNQVVAAQAAQATSDAANKDLQAKVDDLTAKLAAVTTQASTDKTTSDKTIADLTAKETDQTAQINLLNEDLKKQKDAYAQVAQLEAFKEAERLKLAGQVIILQRLVDDREIKNLELFKTGNEILTRYEQFSLGNALAAKEPFIGVTRVKLENLVQDYKDKLLDHAVRTGTVTSNGLNPASGTTAAQIKPATKTQTKTGTPPESAPPIKNKTLEPVTPAANLTPAKKLPSSTAAPKPQ